MCSGVLSVPFSEMSTAPCISTYIPTLNVRYSQVLRERSDLQKEDKNFDKDIQR